jgi:arylsulfatase
VTNPFVQDPAQGAGKPVASGLVSRALLAAFAALAAVAARAENLPRPAPLFAGSEEVASGHFSSFGGFRSAGTETFDIGKDNGSPVSAAYENPFAFTGKVAKVEIDVKP